MNTKLSAVSDKRMDLTCSACGQEFSYKIADLILATSDDITAHEVRQRAVCRGCGVRIEIIITNQCHNPIGNLVFVVEIATQLKSKLRIRGGC